MWGLYRLLKIGSIYKSILILSDKSINFEILANTISRMSSICLKIKPIYQFELPLNLEVF